MASIPLDSAVRICPMPLDVLRDQRQRLLDDAKLHAHRHADRKLTASEAI